MITLWIALGVLGFIALLLCIPVRLMVRQSDELYLAVGWLFLRFVIAPRGPGKPKKEKSARGQKKEKEKKANPFADLIREKGVIEALEEISSLARILLRKFRRLLSHVVIRPLRLSLSAGFGDAADTAIRYGQICAVLYPLLAAVSELIPIRRAWVDIRPDYLEQGVKIEFAMTARLQPIFVVVAAVGMLMAYIRFRSRTRKQMATEPSKNTKESGAAA